MSGVTNSDVLTMADGSTMALHEGPPMTYTVPATSMNSDTVVDSSGIQMIVTHNQDGTVSVREEVTLGGQAQIEMQSEEQLQVQGQEELMVQAQEHITVQQGQQITMHGQEQIQIADGEVLQAVELQEGEVQAVEDGAEIEELHLQHVVEGQEEALEIADGTVLMTEHDQVTQSPQEVQIQIISTDETMEVDTED